MAPPSVDSASNDEGATLESKPPPEVAVMGDDEMAEEWVDRTNEPLLEIGNGYELTSTLRSLYLTNNRLTEIKNLEDCVALRELVLRQNAIKAVTGLENLGELDELDLYMNQITEVSSTCFAGNPKLKKLDLSFNQLRDLKGFPSQNLPIVEELYLIGNKIKEVDGLHSMPKLVMLELGDNRLRKIERLDELTSLHGLWLGRNKITRMEGLRALTGLKRLSIQSNRIENIEGLDHLVHLEELYLSHNGISSMNGIQNLSSLRVLDLGANFIEHIQHVDKLGFLKEFWMNGNKLKSFEELHLLCKCSLLETVYLEGNPLSQEPNYEIKALEILPDSLKQLDALLVQDVRRQLEERATAANEPNAEYVEELDGDIDDIAPGDHAMNEGEGTTAENINPDIEGGRHMNDEAIQGVDYGTQGGTYAIETGTTDAAMEVDEQD